MTFIHYKKSFNMILIYQCFFCSTSLFASDTTTQLNPISVEAQKEQLEQDYKRIDVDDIKTIKGTNNSDIFGSETSLSMNNARNEAGSIDVGIRALQGNGRVPIVIDGSLQSTNTWRGYQGSADRTYVDIDLIKTIDITKGSSNGKFSGGAVGGKIIMQTISADDIIQKGNNHGFWVKGKLYNNNKQPNIPDDAPTQMYGYEQRDQLKDSVFNNGAFSFGTAYKNDLFDVLAAYSERHQGNYFAGKKGYDQYPSDTNLVPIRPGSEVTNTSYNSQSLLLKGGVNLDRFNRLEVNFRRHEQDAGELLAAYWSLSTLKNAKQTLPQWREGNAIVNSSALNYTYNPESSWIDLGIGLWHTKGTFDQLNARGTGIIDVSHGDQYKAKYSDERLGLNIENTSELTGIPLKLTYGLEYMRQKNVPLSKSYNVEREAQWDENDELIRDPETGKVVYKDIYTEALPFSRHATGDSKSIYLNSNYSGALFSAMAGWRINSFKVNDYLLRFNDPNAETKSSYKWKNDFIFAITGHVNDQLDIVTKYSDRYRNPSLFESTRSGQQVSYNIKTPIKPEHAQSFDFGLNYNQKSLLSPDDHLTAKLNYFHANIKDFLSQGVDSNQISPAYSYLVIENYDKFVTSGYELELEYDSKHWFGGVNYTHTQKTEVCSALEAAKNNLPACNSLGFAWSLQPMRIPPQNIVSAVLGAKFLDNQFNMGVRSRYSSKKDYPEDFLVGTGARGVQKIHSNTLWDLFAQYNLNKTTKLLMNVENITNQYYFDIGTVIYKPAPGRTVSFALEAKF